EIFTLVERELVRSGCDEYLTSGIVLTGGCANLGGIARVAEQVFNLPVRVGGPANVGGLKDLVSSPEYATAVGLVLWGSSAAQRSRSMGRPVIGRAVKKVSNWLGEYF